MSSLPSQLSQRIEAVAGVVVSVAASSGTANVVVGGPWLAASGFIELLKRRTAELAGEDIDVRAAVLGESAALIGARHAALRSAQLHLAGRG